MLSFIGKRILWTIFTVAAVIFCVFAIVKMAPGDPATLMLGLKATPEAIAQLNAQLGYDRPFLIQYIVYLKDFFFHFDLGTSFKYGTSVMAEIMQRLPVTLTLALGTTVIASVIAFVTGVICASHHGSKFDSFVCSVCGIITAVPSYATGIILMIIFSVMLHWTPIYGLKTWKGYILPIASLVIAVSGYLIITVRNVLMDTIYQDHIRTARALGESPRRVLFVYALRASLIPIITTIGYQFASLLGGTVVIESLFSLNGIGSLVVTAVMAKDIPLILGVTIFLTLTYCGMQLLMEISYAFLDPRVKASIGGGH